MKKQKDKRKKERKTAVLRWAVLAILLGGCGAEREDVLLVGRGEEVSLSHPAREESAQETPPPEQTPRESPAAEVYVYVCGAVREPGVVALKPGSRAQDALEAAGGFSEEAWREYVNLAQAVTDGEKLYFPRLEEAQSLLSPENDREGLVNINTADGAALCTLPGIGESRAGDILSYREKNGAFEKPEDIMKVPGIKDSVYQKLKDKITVR